VTARAPAPLAGATGGALATLAFIGLHDVWILDIWAMTGPMVTAGALSAFALAWSYRTTLGTHSTRRWLAYNGLTTLLLAGQKRRSSSCRRTTNESGIDAPEYDRPPAPSRPIFALNCILQ
jgi:hypothetical protein